MIPPGEGGETPPLWRWTPLTYAESVSVALQLQYAFVLGFRTLDYFSLSPPTILQMSFKFYQDTVGLIRFPGSKQPDPK